MPELTQQQIDEMRAALAAYDAQVAQAKSAQDAEFVAPLKAIINSKAYKAVADQLTALIDTYKDDFYIHAHLNAIVTAMPNLVHEIERRA